MRPLIFGRAREHDEAPDHEVGGFETAQSVEPEQVTMANWPVEV
ncbi:hypothetical protein [uncultured Microbacterium sp.]|nr:hypothetical protein [uncultured Microbacterium sp.]